MSITYERDGSVTLRSDTDLTKSSKIPAGTAAADQATQIVAFFATSAAPVPDMVSNYQARSALLAAGLFTNADAAVRGAGNPVAVQAWDYANNFYRTSPFIAGLGSGLGLSPAQIDDLFRKAALIDA